MAKLTLTAKCKLRYPNAGETQSIYLLSGSEEALEQYREDLRAQGQPEKYINDEETGQPIKMYKGHIPFPLNTKMVRNEETGRWYLDNSEYNNKMAKLKATGDLDLQLAFMERWEKTNSPATFGLTSKVEEPAQEVVSNDDAPE